MAVDMFLEFNEGKAAAGESQDKVHKDKIDVLAWSWGCSQSGSFHTGGGGGAGKANFQDISVTKWIDKSSPDLMLTCANGSHYEQAKLIVRKAGGDNPIEYITISMKKVLVTSVSTGGSGGEDRLTENVTLNFAQVLVKYVEQTPEGKEGKQPEFKWDIAANCKL